MARTDAAELSRSVKIALGPTNHFSHRWLGYPELYRSCWIGSSHPLGIELGRALFDLPMGKALCERRRGAAGHAHILLGADGLYTNVAQACWDRLVFIWTACGISANAGHGIR